MDRKSGLHNGNKRKLPDGCQPVNLLHAQILSSLISPTQLPVESMQQVGQARSYHLQTQTVSRTHPPTRPEWQQLETLTFHVKGFVTITITRQEPLRSELLWRVPHRRVSPDAPSVHEDTCPLADVVAADVAVLESLVGRE